MVIIVKISMNFKVSCYNNRVLPIVDLDVIAVIGSRRAKVQGLMNLTKGSALSIREQGRLSAVCRLVRVLKPEYPETFHKAIPACVRGKEF